MTSRRSTQSDSGGKRKQRDQDDTSPAPAPHRAVLDEQRTKQGRDTAGLKRDLQALSIAGEQTAAPPSGSCEPLKMRKRAGPDEAAAREKIKASGQSEEIVSLMKKHVGAARVQEAGCRALTDLYAKADNTQVTVRPGGNPGANG